MSKVSSFAKTHLYGCVFIFKNTEQIHRMIENLAITLSSLLLFFHVTLSRGVAKLVGNQQITQPISKRSLQLLRERTSQLKALIWQTTISERIIWKIEYFLMWSLPKNLNFCVLSSRSLSSFDETNSIGKCFFSEARLFVNQCMDLLQIAKLSRPAVDGYLTHRQLFVRLQSPFDGSF